MPWSPRCQSSGESYGACQEHPEWPKQETVPKGREAVRCFLCAAECRRSRRQAVMARGGIAAWQASICSNRESQLNTAMISSWDVSYILLLKFCCLLIFWKTWEGTMTMEYKHRHFMLRFSSENPFQVFSCLFEMKLDFSIFHWWSFHIYVNALGFIISSLNLILCINQAFYSPYLFFYFGFLLNVSQTNLCSHPDFLGLCSHQVSLWIFKNCSIY